MSTLTAPFRPLTMHFRPLDGELFLPFPKLLRAGLLRRLDPEIIGAEVCDAARGLPRPVRPRARFRRRPPACAALSRRSATRFLRAVKEKAPDAWVRQGGRNQPLGQRLAAPKALCSTSLSAQFRSRAARAGHRAQSGLLPAPMIIPAAPDFAALMRRVPRRAAGRRRRDVPSRLCRRRARQPRSAHQRSARTSTPISPASDFPALLAANKVTLA